MKYRLEEIAKILNTRMYGNSDTILSGICFDSRKISQPDLSIFIALKGDRDGHDYILNAYEKGIRHFIIEDESVVNDLPLNYIIVEDTLDALQRLAKHHREKFDIPVIGITGSNGKTICKEWLEAALKGEYTVVKSPQSFNSQIGVPLSVLQLNHHHTIAIFEAGISQKGEMKKLANIIQPTIGLFTSFGDAHEAGFKNNTEKLKEKIQLFDTADCIVLPNSLYHQCESYLKNKKTCITTDAHSIREHNSNLCIAVAKEVGVELDNIEELFKSVPLRMTLEQGIDNNIIINDSYSLDLRSLELALQFQSANDKNKKKIIFISDFVDVEPDFEQLNQLIRHHNIDKIIHIGNESKIDAHHHYASTSELLKQIHLLSIKDSCILFKGARKYAFEKLVDRFKYKRHDTVFEVNLNAIVHNYKTYKNLLKPSTEIMAMVKASAYGTGSIEVAQVLENAGISHLCVAYPDEGVELRNHGINSPIMVLNVHKEQFDLLNRYDLEAEIYAVEQLLSLADYANQNQLNLDIHLKLNTGMNRLGLEKEEIYDVLKILQNSQLKVLTIFTHLASTDDASDDDYTLEQIELFTKMANVIDPQAKRHVLNSAGVVRFPKHQMEMVRVGIGLYGIDPSNTIQPSLKPVASFNCQIAQIKTHNQGDTIGYNRKGALNRETTIATLKVGYADGIPRIVGNNKGHFYLHNRLAPIVGNVCMDMVMIDITDIPQAKIGDIVEIFGDNRPVQDFAEEANTISYEILTNIGNRAKRVFYQD